MNRALDLFYARKAPCRWINKSVGVPIEINRPPVNDGTETKLNTFLPQNVMQHWDNMSMHTLYKSNLSGIPDPVPIHVINLNDRPDRMAEWSYHWKDVLKSSFFKVQRVPGIKWSPGWIGCALSQLRCIEMAKLRGDPYCIIMEDDCAPLCSHFDRRFMHIMGWLHEHLDDWEIFNAFPAATIPNIPLSCLDRDLGIYETNGGVNHHLIVVNASMFDKLLALKDLYLETDASEHREALCIDEITNRHTKVVTAYPFLVSTYSDCSDIDDGATCTASQKLRYMQPERRADNCTRDICKDITICITAAKGRDTNYRRTLDSIRPMIQRGAQLFVADHGSHLENLRELYSNDITTKYVLHCEDDWTFTDDVLDCLEYAKDVLTLNGIGQVWLRDINDLMGHPVKYHNIGGFHLYLPFPNHMGIYNGFTLNPSLLLTETMLDRIASLEDKEYDSQGMEIALNKGWADSMGTACLPVGCVWHNGEISTKNKMYQKVHDLIAA